MIIKKVGVLSLGKTMGAIYALFGLIFGAMFSLISLLGMAASFAGETGGEAIFGLIFGVGAIIALPIFYGIMGFLGGLLTAAVYNFISRWTGGLEIETG